MHSYPRAIGSDTVEFSDVNESSLSCTYVNFSKTVNIIFPNS